MKPINSTKQPLQESTNLGMTQYHYAELIEYLDKRWLPQDEIIDLSMIKTLDKAFGFISKDLTSIIIAGTNGKSITADLTARLLQEEGLVVGSFLSPHILNYNERISIKREAISNKLFTELGNEVISMAYSLAIEPDSLTILTMMSFLYFHKMKIDVAIFEQSRKNFKDPVSIINPVVFTITRLSDNETTTHREEINKNIATLFETIHSNTHVVSADQNKSNLNTMEALTKEHNAIWHMAIRKLIPLGYYPSEQIHGRCAALAERIAFIFINFLVTNTTNNEASNKVITNSILAKQKGRRGRPTIEAKRQSTLQPQKTVQQFWKEITATLPHRFQLLEKEKPTVLLDSASNLDALKNILLGIRLLHYQKPLKGFTLILGFTENISDTTEFLRTLRYFFKKTSGNVILCSVNPLPGHHNKDGISPEKLTNEIKAMKVKAKYIPSFTEAFQTASAGVDERNGLILITGSPSIITEYWKYKGLKK